MKPSGKPLRLQGGAATSRSDRKKVWLVTENSHKLREARAVLSNHNISLGQIRMPKVEIQSQDLEEIALFAARSIAEKVDRPIIVEDSGLFISALNGFPGPYSSYVLQTLGLDGILRLVERARGREAYFQSSIATHLEGSVFKTFSGRVNGVISRRKAGRRGFGYDPIFALRLDSKTFGQMPESEKNRYSHRAFALRKFAKWFLCNDHSIGPDRSPAEP